jgi:hypothetical protein
MYDLEQSAHRTITQLLPIPCNFFILVTPDGHLRCLSFSLEKKRKEPLHKGRHPSRSFGCVKRAHTWNYRTKSRHGESNHACRDPSEDTKSAHFFIELTVQKSKSLYYELSFDGGRKFMQDSDWLKKHLQ